MSAPDKIQKAMHAATFSRYEFLAANVYVGDNEMDLFGVRKSGYCDELEMKLTRSDFLADFKKTRTMKTDGPCSPIGWPRNPNYRYTSLSFNKHDMLRAGKLPSNYFSFVLPKGLIELDEIPKYAGVFEWTELPNGRIKVIETRRAPRLHDRKISETLYRKVLKAMAYRFWI